MQTSDLTKMQMADYTRDGHLILPGGRNGWGTLTPLLCKYKAVLQLIPTRNLIWCSVELVTLNVMSLAISSQLIREMLIEVE